jgi:hypothetical protein
VTSDPRGALADAACADPVRAEWTFDPWTERPAVASLGALAVLAMWLIIATSGFPWLVALGLGVAAASPLWAAFVGADCRVDARGAARRGLLGWVHRPWDGIRRIDDVPAGVLLSPSIRRHPLEGVRALVLPMPGPRRAELAAQVRECWRLHGR